MRFGAGRRGTGWTDISPLGVAGLLAFALLLPGACAGPKSWLTPKAGESWREPATGMEFVWVVKGCFPMGQAPEEKAAITAQIGTGGYRDWYSSGELPRHEVCVNGFWMGRTEVTNREYRIYDPGHVSEKRFGESLDVDDQPVVMVSWEEATAYARWFSGETGLPVRLPTEAQWEYAARGGSVTSRHWGDDPDAGCRFENLLDQKGVLVIGRSVPPTGGKHRCDDGYGTVAPAGRFLPNPFGLHDMLGNVQEWCADWYGHDYYAASPKENPPGPEIGSSRSIRGGSWWMTFPGLARSAARFRRPPEERNATTGFRLVISEGR